MTRREIHRFEKVLKDRKAGLVRALRKCLDRTMVPQTADPVDQVADLTEQEVDSRIVNLTMARLRSLEGALRAIHDGNFGRCTSCDGEIPLQRLEAVPWSACCVACQERSETPAAPRE